MLSDSSCGSMCRPTIAGPIQCAVAGMSCITPMAPTLDRAFWLQWLSCQAMARASAGSTP